MNLPSTKHKKIAVIGGGISGLLTTINLAQAGNSVSLITDDSNKNYASLNAAGLLFPLQPKQIPSAEFLDLQESINWYDDYAKMNDISYQHISALVESDPFSADPWFKHELVSPGIISFSNAHSLDPRRLLVCLRKALSAMSNVCIITKPATKIYFANSKIQQVETIETVVEADDYFICAGAWSSSLVPGCELVTPVRGILLRYNPKEWLMKNPYIYDGGYLIQHTENELLAGTTREMVGFSDSIKTETITTLRLKAEKICPPLSTIHPKEILIGFRPHADGVVVKRHNEFKNLILHYGHSGHGISTAPATAKRAAALLEKIN